MTSPHCGDKFLKGFKYRLYPTAEQRPYLARTFGACRYVYNRHIAENQLQFEAWKAGTVGVSKPSVSAFTLMNALPRWKLEPETAWLNDISARVIQEACTNVSEAFQRFFSGKGYPRFKSRKGRQSATFSNQIYRIENGKLRLPKCETTFKVNFHRPLPENAKLKSCTVSMTPTGKYYVSFLCEYTPEKTSGRGYLGIDAGITDLATQSNGEVLQNPKHYLTAQHRLRILQRRLSKKQKGSKNRNKARLAVAKCHEKIANQRKDYLHKYTTRTIRENQAVCIEHLQVRNMLRNRRLSKHIADAGWSEMRRQLTYKAIASQHCMLVLADPYFPSTQLCSCCGKKPGQKLALSVRKWICPHCGATHQRDLNASVNLEILGRTMYHKHKDLPEVPNIVLSGRYTPIVQ